MSERDDSFTAEDLKQLREIAAEAEAERDYHPGGICHPLYERELWAKSMVERLNAVINPGGTE